MDNQILNKQKKVINEIDKIISNNKVSHAYFFEHNGNGDYKDILVYFCRELLKNSVSLKNIDLINENFDYPEIKFLEANGKNIKKEQIKTLQKECLEKPILGKYIIYIIDGAEYLNASSANTLLKFLEEPEDNIIGVLVSNSRYQVIDTLISRCQILSLSPSDDNNNVDGAVINFINKVKNKDYSLFIDIKDIYSLEKKEILIFLNEIQNFCLNNIDNSYSISIIKIIEEKKEKLKYNLNIKLFLDNLVLELLEV